MISDYIADTLARIKNGVNRSKDSVEVLKSKAVKDVLDVMKQEEFISDYAECEDGNCYTVTLSYEENGEPTATSFTKVSKPGQRIYVSTDEILPVMNGRGISIISTSKGIMTGAQAKAQNVGGEYICKVW